MNQHEPCLIPLESMPRDGLYSSESCGVFTKICGLSPNELKWNILELETWMMNSIGKPFYWENHIWGLDGFRVWRRGCPNGYWAMVDLRIPSSHPCNPRVALYELVVHAQGTPTHTNTKDDENGIYHSWIEQFTAWIVT